MQNLYRKEAAVLAVGIDAGTERRLEALAARIGQTKTFYAREAILAYLDDLEDFYIAEERAKDFRSHDPVPPADLKPELFLVD